MQFRPKYLGFLAIGLVMCLFGWKGYAYFFDRSQPKLALLGIEPSQCCAGDVSCMVSASKSGDISIYLDGQPLVQQFRLSKSDHGHSFSVPTKTINDGKHVLKAVFSDTTFSHNKAEIEREFFVDNVPLQAAFVQSDAQYKVLQGRTLHVQFQTNKEIKEARVSTLSKTYEAFPESQGSNIYEAFIPVECEEKANEYLMSVDLVDAVGNALRLDNKFLVVKYPFKTSRLVVDAEKIKKEEELGYPRKEFEKLVTQLTENSVKEKLWRGEFCTPIEIRQVTTEFGTVRTTEHKGRYAHKAIDVVNMPRSIIWAPQDGIVVCKDRFADSGNTVILDHGYGVLSMFFHLEDFANINIGDKVAQGNPLGKLGKTGYASGYHLHWEMRVNNVQVDPMQWTKTTF
jgi:murein DD-endopeptidase MepM/ murein hydrolase activator NlpD